MKTPEEILIDNCPVFSSLFHDKTNKASVTMKESILKSMEQYAAQRIVDVTFERDEIDEQYKMAVSDRNTAREMYKETVQERDGWMTEANELKSKVDELNLYIEELENTLGLRNRSNPDLTIDDEPKSVFDKWKECKD
jgi:hypothetical protein